MAVGQPLTKSDIDNTVASLSRAMNNLLFQIQTFTQRMDATVDGTLTTLGYSGADITLLRTAYRDLDHSRMVHQGLAYVTAGATNNTGAYTVNDVTHFGYDFRTFTNQVDNVGY